MTLDQCYATYQGQSVSFDGIAANRGQCVQWVELVHTKVYGAAPFWGNAIDWWNNFSGSLPAIYDRIPYVGGQVARKGDLVIWGAGVGSVYGHIDVCAQDGNGSGFLGYDTNWAGNKTVHPVQHSYQYVIGFLRPKTNNSPQGGSMIPDQDNYYWRFNKLMLQIRGRNMDRAEFQKNFVGVEPFHMVEILSDSTEADAATARQVPPVPQDLLNFMGAVYKIDTSQQSAKDIANALAPLGWHDAMYQLAGQFQGNVEPVSTSTALNKQLADVTTENTVLRQQLAAEDAQIKDPNKIIITNKGWSALWAAIQSFFNKNN